MSKSLLLFVIFAIVLSVNAQEEQQINPLIYDATFQVIKNENVLHPFYAQLDSLKKGSNKQLTVVHIGDSHMQGPYFPRHIRTALQDFAGNAGRGFVFPYRVAGTNGGIDVKFKSPDQWKAVRNVKSDGSDNVGISGINLETTQEDFLLEMNIKEELVDTRVIEVFSPDPSAFKLSLASKKDIIKSKSRFKNYTVQRGDYLGKIASKFGTSVSAIKKLNAFKNDNISAGQSIKVPVKQGGKKGGEDIVFSDLKKLVSGKYHLPAGHQQVYIRPAKKATTYVLDGLSLLNTKPGVIYHAIGVNGTKFSDYNKFPRFFDQLAIINPDLIIISLGTNESFYTNYTEEDLLKEMDAFNRELLKRELTGSVILTSPPPSMKNKRQVNSLATAFSYEMGVFANLNSWAFYDLHSVSRGSAAMNDWYAAGLTARDKIHFIEGGYKLQAQLFIAALLKSYNSYKE